MPRGQTATARSFSRRRNTAEWSRHSQSLSGEATLADPCPHAELTREQPHFRPPGVGPRLAANSDTELTPVDFSLICFGFFNSRLPFRLAISSTFLGDEPAALSGKAQACSVALAKSQARATSVWGCWEGPGLALAVGR